MGIYVIQKHFPILGKIIIVVISVFDLPFTYGTVTNTGTEQDSRTMWPTISVIDELTVFNTEDASSDIPSL